MTDSQADKREHYHEHEARWIQPGSDLYYSTLHLNADKQHELRVLATWYEELTHITTEHREAQVAATRLSWWFEETERLFRDEARHPVSIELRRLVVKHRFQESDFLGIIHKMARIFEDTPFQETGQLEDYARNTLGKLMLLQARCLNPGMPSESILAPELPADAIEQLAVGIQVLIFLQHLAPDLQRGRFYLPLQLLAQQGLQPDLLYQMTAAKTSQIRPFIKQILQLARERINSGYQGLLKQNFGYYKNLAVRARILCATGREIEKELDSEITAITRMAMHLTPLRMLLINWSVKLRPVFFTRAPRC